MLDFLFTYCYVRGDSPKDRSKIPGFIDITTKVIFKTSLHCPQYRAASSHTA